MLMLLETALTYCLQSNRRLGSIVHKGILANLFYVGSIDAVASCIMHKETKYQHYNSNNSNHTFGSLNLKVKLPASRISISLQINHSIFSMYTVKRKQGKVQQLITFVDYHVRMNTTIMYAII
jgi:hypothetical protein